ncbi:MAG TPA: response regulator [Dehalococcoidia bacterium]|nr:response regulator [Dehalococcoidia bacterium]
MVDQDTSHRTILLVEDDPGIAALERWGLEAAGFEVIEVSTGRAALDKVRQNRVDLVVLDYRLADGMTGLDIYAQMEAEGFDIPGIMVTAYSEEEITIGALRAGVRDFLPKSTEFLDYLPHAVRRVLERDEAERRLAVERAETVRLEGALLAAHTMQHHLSNQLAVTVGYAEMLTSMPHLPDDLRECAEAALRGAEEASRTLAQIQQITRIVEAPLRGGPPILDLDESVAGGASPSADDSPPSSPAQPSA